MRFQSDTHTRASLTSVPGVIRRLGIVYVTRCILAPTYAAFPPDIPPKMSTPAKAGWCEANGDGATPTRVALRRTIRTSIPRDLGRRCMLAPCSSRRWRLSISDVGVMIIGLQGRRCDGRRQEGRGVACPIRRPSPGFGWCTAYTDCRSPEVIFSPCVDRRVIAILFFLSRGWQRCNVE